MVLKPGELLKAKELKKAVEKADFTPGDMHAKVTGTVAANTEKETAQMTDLSLKLPDTGQIFLLVSLALETEGEKAPDSKDLLPKLRQAFKSGKTKFTIFGRIHEHKDLPIGLTVLEFVEVQP